MSFSEFLKEFKDKLPLTELLSLKQTAAAPEKCLRFRTTTDASEIEVIVAMLKYDNYSLLDFLIREKRYDRTKGKKDVAAKRRKEDEEETKRFLKSQREALVTCLKISAQRYKTPWCQTVLDILVKHAFDNVARFAFRQRDAIEKLWASVK